MEREGEVTASDSPMPADGQVAAASGRPRLALDLATLAIIGVLLIAAVAAGTAALYQQFYSPAAFVGRYLSLLSEGRAAEALAMPGVAVDSASLERAGLPQTSSDALLREAALAQLSDVRTVAEEPVDGITRVTATFSAGGYDGQATFSVEPHGWIGVAPAWRFAQTPLAVIDLTVSGSMQFSVNGFEIDKRQVSPEGVDADPLAAVPLLVFSPGIYSVSVDTAMSSSPGVAVLSDSPEKAIPITLQAQPTEKFIEVVQERVDEFLTSCTTQQVLQPTGCPFGFVVQNRINALPTWSVVENPTVTLEPDGANWTIPPADAVAHIEVSIKSLFDGSIRQVSEDVPFQLTGSVSVLPDGTASIELAGVDQN